MTVAHHEISLPQVGATIALNINGIIIILGLFTLVHFLQYFSVVRSPSCFYISLKPFNTFIGDGDETMLVKLNKQMNAW